MCVRTTVDVDESILAAAKERALRRRTTLSRVVEDAIKAYLEAGTPAGEAEPFHLITAGEPGGSCPSPREMAALLDDEDAGRGR